MMKLIGFFLGNVLTTLEILKNCGYQKNLSTTWNLKHLRIYYIFAIGWFIPNHSRMGSMVGNHQCHHAMPSRPKTALVLQVSGKDEEVGVFSATEVTKKQCSKSGYPGCLGFFFRGWHPTQWYGDCNKPLQGSLSNSKYSAHFERHHYLWIAKNTAGSPENGLPWKRRFLLGTISFRFQPLVPEGALNKP